MADTSEIKKEIREVVKKLAVKFGVVFAEENIIPNGKRYHGVSGKEICVFVCNNHLQEGKIKAGQRASIFEKCYWLSLSECKQKLLVFTDKDFYNKFMDEYSVYLKEIKLELFNYLNC